MIGSKFGRLTVLREGEAACYPSGKRCRRMLCRCVCGTERLVLVEMLRNGRTRSCGCLHREMARERAIKRNRRQGDLARNMRIIVDGFLGFTTDYLHFVPVDDTYALVDEEDFVELGQINWHLKQGMTGIYYAYCSLIKEGKHTTLQMHRVILPLPKRLDVDHRNHNGLDNRRENLRPATRSQNQANQRNLKTNKKNSRYRGVFGTGHKWQAQIGRGGKSHHLGTFASEIEAALAYNAAAKKHFGEFARVNEIPRQSGGGK